uniref:Transposase Tc1-like domain-containing protein n=1 Tax=Bactrocera latifrons TaxID=174628 RepID=A0A0K8UXM1_BACLA
MFFSANCCGFESKPVGSRQSGSYPQKRRNCQSNVKVRGRKRLLTDADACLTMARMKKDKCLTPGNAALEIGKSVSRWTARTSLHKIGYISAVKKQKPALSVKNAKARLKFARDHVNWTEDDWKRVIW